MCIAFFILGGGDAAAGGQAGSRGRPLFFLAFNRDEYLLREAAPLHFWEEHPGVLAGRDLEGKGTWLGVSTTGRVAFLTNLRAADPVEPSSLVPGPHSRGDIPVNFLTSSAPPKEYLEGLRGQDFHGFNVVLGDLTTAEFVYGHNGTGRVVPQPLQRGVPYGISNGKLGEWPKVQAGLEVFRGLLPGFDAQGGGPGAPWERVLDELLGDNTRELPAPPPHEPAGFQKVVDYVTSARFVDKVDTPYGPYGTRSKTLIAIWPDGTAEARERHLDPDGQWRDEEFYFRVQAGRGAGSGGGPCGQHSSGGSGTAASGLRGQVYTWHGCGHGCGGTREFGVAA